MPAKRRKTARAAEDPSTAEATRPGVAAPEAPARGNAPDGESDAVIAARAAAEAVRPAPGEAAAPAAGPRAYPPDPFSVLSVAVGEGAAAPRVRLFRSRRMNQVAVGFDEKPPEPVRRRLRDEGYKWREAEGVWTKQLGDQRATGQLAAERLVGEVANAIRAAGGLPPVGPAVGG